MPPSILRRPTSASYFMAIMFTPWLRGVENDAQSLRVVVHTVGDRKRLGAAGREAAAPRRSVCQPDEGSVAHSRTAPLSMPRMNWRWKKM